MINCDIIKGGLQTQVESVQPNWTLDSVAVWIRTDLLLDVVGHVGHFVEQTNRLVHPLVNHTQVGQNLRAARGRSVSFNATQRESQVHGTPQSPIAGVRFLST